MFSFRVDLHIDIATLNVILKIFSQLTFKKYQMLNTKNLPKIQMDQGYIENVPSLDFVDITCFY